MNKFPLSRRFIPKALVATPAEARLPFRLWMTGSLAVVMAALIPMRELTESPRPGQRQGQGQIRLLRHSRFDVDETVKRIEAAAQRQGLGVLARLGGDRPVIVLASSVGGTLVVMDEADSPPAIPLGLIVRPDSSGGADVLDIGGAPADQRAWRGLPEAVMRDVAALPALVERALS